MHHPSFDDRFAMHYEPDHHRRVIAGQAVIIHCHHYNTRVQRTLEHARLIDGAHIIRSSAEAVFAEQITASLRDDDELAHKLAVTSALYTRLGFGLLDFDALDSGLVRAPSSHYVEGWLAGFGQSDSPVCTFTEGYLQAAIWAATGRLVDVRERECMAKGDACCSFEIDTERERPLERYTKRGLSFDPQPQRTALCPAHVDEQGILDAIVAMPLQGDAQGLIPAFGVYLANTPADYYNLVAIRFVEQMRSVGRGKAAKRMLIADGETCALNTFRGIMASVEWESLVAPMIRDRRDNLFALVAISNGLGWGNWQISAHPSADRAELQSFNGYEALGYSELRGASADPVCYMLTGVAAGLLALVYEVGTAEELFGCYYPVERACICQPSIACRFSVERCA